MRKLKEQLLRHENIWSHIRRIKRKTDAFSADKEHYFAVKWISQKSLEDTEHECTENINAIIDSIDLIADRESPQAMDYYCKNIVPQSQLEMLSNMGDQMGKVFTYQGEIYRGIVGESVEDFLQIWSSGVLQGLAKWGIIPAVEIADFKTEEFPLVLHVEKVYMQKNTVWSYAMVLDACVLISTLYNVLQKYGLTLCDGHLNNISFNEGKAIFVDIGSIIPGRPTGAMEEVTFGGLYRLLFGLLGNCMLYRLPSHDAENNNIYVLPRFYNQFTRDYRYCLKKFKTMMLFKSGIRGYYITHRVFDLFDVRPEYIKAIFEDKLPGKVEYGTSVDFFSLVNWNEIQGKTIIDTGGAYIVIKDAIKNGYNFKFVKFIDFNEKRLDYSYRNYDNNNNGTEISFSLINYMYLHSDSQIDQLKSDVVFCVNPFSNSASFQGDNISSVIYALQRIGNEYAIIFVDLNIDSVLKENYKQFIGSLGVFYEIEEKSRDDIRCIIGRRK